MNEAAPRLLLGLSVMGFGACGALARYLCQLWLAGIASAGFPWGTLAVNSVGSLIMGMLAGWALVHDALPEPVRLGLTVGLLGSFTTFSTFSLDTVKLFESGAVPAAFGNVLANLVLCIGLCVAGLVIGRALH